MPGTNNVAVGAGDMIQFDTTNNANCIVDQPLEVYKFLVLTDYSGKVMLKQPLTINRSTNAATMAEFVFASSKAEVRGYVGSDGVIQHGNLTLSPNTFATWTSGTLANLTVDAKRDGALAAVVKVDGVNHEMHGVMLDVSGELR